VSVNGYIARDVDAFQTDLKIGYGKETVGLKTDLEKKPNSLKAHIAVALSEYPDAGVAIKFDETFTLPIGEVIIISIFNSQ